MHIRIYESILIELDDTSVAVPVVAALYEVEIDPELYNILVQELHREGYVPQEVWPKKPVKEVFAKAEAALDNWKIKQAKHKKAEEERKAKISKSKAEEKKNKEVLFALHDKASSLGINPKIYTNLGIEQLNLLIKDYESIKNVT